LYIIDVVLLAVFTHDPTAVAEAIMAAYLFLNPYITAHGNYLMNALGTC
jgi:hypothetical protein